MVLPSDVVEQDVDLETLAGEEGVENSAEGPTEGILVPLDSEGGELVSWSQELGNQFQKAQMSLSMPFFKPGTSIIWVHFVDKQLLKSLSMERDHHSHCCPDII